MQCTLSSATSKGVVLYLGSPQILRAAALGRCLEQSRTAATPGASPTIPGRHDHVTYIHSIQARCQTAAMPCKRLPATNARSKGKSKWTDAIVSRRHESRQTSAMHLQLEHAQARVQQLLEIYVGKHLRPPSDRLWSVPEQTSFGPTACQGVCGGSDWRDTNSIIGQP
jgi:hypothetical protein